MIHWTEANCNAVSPSRSADFTKRIFTHKNNDGCDAGQHGDMGEGGA